MIRRLTYLLVIFIIWQFVVTKSYSQGFQTPFGKSKVQYGKFDWFFYRTKTLEVYYYGGGKNLAQYTLANADKFVHEIDRLLDNPINNRIIIVIYNTYSDFRQSNITLIDEVYNTGGLTPIVDNIAFIYFDGSHKNFDKRIRAAITEVLLNEMIYGGSIQERIQNAALINLPDWYYDGLISFISHDWDLKKKEKLESGILSEHFKKFGRLNDEERVLVGHAIWDYIVNAYGEVAIPNMVYITKINKNIESGYNFVLGKSFKHLYQEWYKSYRYLLRTREGDYQDIKNLVEIKRLHKKGELTNVKLSPKGDKIAYVTNDRGKYRVWSYDIAQNKKKRILSKSYKRKATVIDHTYPLIAWHPRNDILTIIDQKRSLPRLIDYNFEEKKKDKRVKNKNALDRLSKVLDFSYDHIGRRMVLSAINKGKSDIYVFEILSNRLFPITNDIFDDLHPRFVNKSTGIVFSSNRISDTLQRKMLNPYQNFNPCFDIFYYDFKKKDKVLKRCTYTETIDELHPNAYDTSYISYLTNENGIINRDAAYLDKIFKHISVKVQYVDTAKYKKDTFYFYDEDIKLVNISSDMLKDTAVSLWDTTIVYKDTSYIHRLTNYDRNIHFYDIQPRLHNVLEVFKDNKKYLITINPIPADIPYHTIKRTPDESISNILKDRIEKSNDLVNNNIESSITSYYNIDSDEQDIKDENFKDTEAFSYYFINDYNWLWFDTTSHDSFDLDKIKKYTSFKPLKQTKSSLYKNYSRTRFGIPSLYFSSFTPDYLVSQFNNNYIHSPYLPYYSDEPIYPFNDIINLMFKIGINDLFKDYRLAGGVGIKGNLTGAEYILSFENLKRRLDQQFIFYRNSETFEKEFTKYRNITNEARIQLKYPLKEYMFIHTDVFGRQDRKITLSSERQTLTTPDVIMNYGGVKFEYVFDNTIKLGLNLNEGTRFKVYYEYFRNLNNEIDKFSVIGADFRNYIKIHRNIIWANRLAFATSSGYSKIVYFLGGTDNWLFPRFNQEIQTDPDENYVYKSLATNMRGFTQNIRNGNSYAVINSELRVPIIKYIVGKPMRSKFLENFQIIGFADVGTAVTGDDPFSNENILNKRVIENDPLRITIVSLGEPIVYGLGAGVRSSFMGYFLKFDYAWGFEANEVVGSVTYLSFGLDF